MEPTAFPGRVGAVAAALPLLALVFVAGCGGSSPATTSATKAHITTAHTTTAASTTTAAAANPHEFPEFRIAMDEATDYLDPGLSDTTEGWGVMWNVYLPLIGYRHANGAAGATLVPYLAEKMPRVSRDGRTYTITLRPGLKYSDGAPVRASDFRAAIERDFQLDSVGVGFFGDIVGAKAYGETKKGHIEGISVNDTLRRIVIHLVQPEGDFENILATLYAAPVPGKTPLKDESITPIPATGP
ncbi:MAG TPA: ABC transporter substrate-binding protein, partial [Gaiellaceae bacterium]|nr:ABC transporter substrate-binding protein [Gaiellaceae bacterium]